MYTGAEIKKLYLIMAILSIGLLYSLEYDNSHFIHSQHKNIIFNTYYAEDYDCDVDLGDLTGNGEINILDVVQSINMVLELSTPNYPCAADFNEDAEINILDIMQIAYYILKN